MQHEKILGIDIGATGMKGAIIDMKTGQLLSERFRFATPKPAVPLSMADTFLEIIKAANWTEGLIGCGFPAIIKNGVAKSAANIDKSWIGTNVEKLFSEVSGLEVKATNDADAAGVAEMQFGAGKGEKGVVILITLGSGLGSAFFIDNKLVPNTELGHFFLKGHHQVVEQYASNKIRKKLNLSWTEWTKRFNKYIERIERLFSPDLIILGGGGSKSFNEFFPLLTTNTRIVRAQFQNNAGIIGAAQYAYQSKE